MTYYLYEALYDSPSFHWVTANKWFITTMNPYVLLSSGILFRIGMENFVLSQGHIQSPINLVYLQKRQYIFSKLATFWSLIWKLQYVCSKSTKGHPSTMIQHVIEAADTRSVL